MKHFTILGHDNAALAIIFDLLINKYGSDLHIKIVSNIKEEENKEKDLPYLNEIKNLKEIFHTDWQYNKNSNLLIAASGRNTRIKIFNFFNKQYNISQQHYSNLIHPKTIIANNINIEKGCLIGPGVTIAPFAQIGNLVNINRNSSIGHHTVVGNFVNINPGVTICGKIKIGNGVTIGAGATIIDNLEIGENTIIGAGSVVTKSIPANVLAYGCPAKIIKNIYSKSHGVTG